jgi:hypothetical protein
MHASGSLDGIQVAAEQGCTSEELLEALDGCILTDLLPLSTSGEITVSGIVSTAINTSLLQIFTELT